MADYPKTVKLKDDTKVTLKLMAEDDLDSLLEFYRSIPESDRLFLRADMTNKKNLEWRFGKLDYDTIYPILALVDGKIIGIATLFRAEFGWKRNLGEVGVLIALDYQRKGLATIFIRDLFFHALKAKIYKLKAEMIESQDSAMAAFERLGFRKEAILKKHVTDVRGRRRDLVLMTLDIEDFWYLLEDFVEGRDFRIH